MSPCTVNLILGPPRSGKTDRALSRYAAELRHWREDPTGPPAVWLGPTLAALNDVRDRLAALASGAWLNPRTATFATLAQEIISQGTRRVRPIGSLEKQRILVHVIGQLLIEQRLRYYAAVAATPGFLRQVGAAIADLKRRDVWPSELHDRSRDDRDRDFAQIYAAYQEHLHQHNLYDAEGRFWAAREELTSSAPAGALRYGLVVLDGFADFTAAQHDLLRLLATHSRELVITLPTDTGDPPRTLLFDKPRRTLAQLEQSFPHLQREFAGEAHYQSAGLFTVAKELFRDDAAPHDTAAGLAIIAADGVQGEIRAIARRVKEMLLAGSARPDDIAVVFPSVDDVATRVAEVFGDFGLPVALDNRRRLSMTPLVRTLGQLVRLAVDDWPFESVLDVVSNRLISLTFQPELDEDADRVALEHCIRRAQLPAGRTLLLEQLHQWAAPAVVDTDISPERQRLVADATLALSALSELDTALSSLTARAPLTQWIANLELALTRLGVLTEDNATTWQILRQQLAVVVQVDERFAAGSQSLAAKDLLELIERVAFETFLPKSADDVGRVRVVSAEAARNLAVEHVFVAGLSEQSYSSVEGPGALYREAEMQRFTDAGPAENIAEQQTGEAMLLFYDMVTRASKSLTLTYPALDDRGQALMPSPYLTELERCFAPGTIPTTVMAPGHALDQGIAPLSRSEWRTTAITAAADGQAHWLAGLVSTPATRQLGQAILRSIECVASRSEREAFGPFEGLLLSQEARSVIARRFSAEHLWSPSQLETYATCPYQFFAQHILRLEPLEDIALRSDHLRKGHLLHQVLAAIHAQQPVPGSTIDEHELVDRFTSTLEQLIAATPLHGLEDALREIECREIHSWATSYALQEVDYRRRWQEFDQPLAPAYFEVRFGPQARSGNSASDAVSVDIPFTLDVGSEQIKLTGQIDRVDMGRVGGVTVFNIIDYKSGKKVKLDDNEIRAGRQLQLPLYALAAEKLLFANQQAVAFAAGYWIVKEGGFAPGRAGMLEIRTRAGSGLAEAPSWADLSTTMKARVAEIISSIRAGQFAVCNEDPHCTRYCDYSKICRIAQIRSLNKVLSYGDTPPPADDA